MSAAHRDADHIVGQAMSGEHVDCSRGCSWCCHQLVILTNWDDGAAILDAVRRKYSDDEFAAFEYELRRQAAAIAALPYDEAERRQWTCPLLRDGECHVYDVRPIACRSVFSSDASCCRAMKEATQFEQLTPAHQELASQIGERAMRLQIQINDRQPVHGPIELRALLVKLLDEQSGSDPD